MLKSKRITGTRDVEELEKQSWEEVCPAKSTYDLIKRTAMEIPDETCITFLAAGAMDERPIQLTYQQVFGRITQAANMFTDKGIGSKDVVSFLLPSLPQTQFTLWGAEAAGIANPINFLLQANQIADLLNTVQTKVLVTLGPHPMLDVWEKVMSIKDQILSLTTVLVVGAEVDESPGIYNFDKLIVNYPADKLVSNREIEPSDVASYFHTGGTTGSPKIAPHTHGAEVFEAWVAVNFWGYEPRMPIFNALPLFHVAGSLLFSLAPMAAGMEIIILTPAGLRNPTAMENHWRLAEKYKVEIVGGIPTSLGSLLNAPSEGVDMSSVKFCVTGGAALPLQVEKDWKKQYDLNIFPMYGLTECTLAMAMSPVHGERVMASTGIRVPFIEMKVGRLETSDIPKDECAPNEIGVVMTRGIHVFPGYLDPRQNKGTLTEDGWLISGDLGYLDAQGNLFITGRSKDLIIRGGHNIDPGIIEEAMVEHPEVELAAAVARPDLYAGELPVLYVQLNPGAKATPDELLSFLTDRISERPALPKEIIIIPAIPVTAIGKIFKPQLKWEQARKVFSNELADLSQQGVQSRVEVHGDKIHSAIVEIYLKGGSEIDKAAIEEEVSTRLNRYQMVKMNFFWDEK